MSQEIDIKRWKQLAGIKESKSIKEWNPFKKKEESGIDSGIDYRPETQDFHEGEVYQNVAQGGNPVVIYPVSDPKNSHGGWWDIKFLDNSYKPTGRSFAEIDGKREGYISRQEAVNRLANGNPKANWKFYKKFAEL